MTQEEQLVHRVLQAAGNVNTKCSESKETLPNNNLNPIFAQNLRTSYVAACSLVPTVWGRLCQPSKKDRATTQDDFVDHSKPGPSLNSLLKVRNRCAEVFLCGCKLEVLNNLPQTATFHLVLPI